MSIMKKYINKPRLLRNIKKRMGFRDIKKFLPAVFIINLIAIVSAYGWGGWGYYSLNSPSDLLQNEWVRFAALFILFFAIVFIAVSKPFKENKGAAIAVAVVVSLFISMAVAQRGWLYSYAGEEMGGYLFIIAIALGIIFLLKVMISLLGGLGLFITLFGLWFLFSKTYFPEILPYEIGSVDLFPFYDFFASDSFLIWTIIALIAVLVVAYVKDESINKRVRRWFWVKSKKTRWDELMSEN